MARSSQVMKAGGGGKVASARPIRSDLPLAYLFVEMQMPLDLADNLDFTDPQIGRTMGGLKGSSKGR